MMRQDMERTKQNARSGGLKPGFSPLGTWAFSIGTSIGWGSFIVTCNTYLQKSGVLGTVFRIGGDEFAVLLTGEDFENRRELLEQLDRDMRDDQSFPGETLAIGMSEYIRGEDSSVLEVFTRADHIMYQRKNARKALLGRT